MLSPPATRARPPIDCNALPGSGTVNLFVLKRLDTTIGQDEWLGGLAPPTMKLIFVDEVEQPQKAPGFFGIGAFIVTSTFYRGLRDDVDDAFEEAHWDRDKEFKGRYLFSSSKGDTSVGIDARIELTQTIVKGTTAAKNARAMFCLAFNYEGRTESNYLALAGRALRKCPKPPNKKGDKCLAAVYYDRTDIAGSTAIGDMVEAAALTRKLTLVAT
jgi:hypothetical protein